MSETARKAKLSKKCEMQFAKKEPSRLLLQRPGLFLLKAVTKWRDDQIYDKSLNSGIYIEQKVNGVWKEFDTLYGVDHPEFYQYDTVDYFDTLYFNDVAGVQYRVTVTAFAMNSNGSDTGTVTSYTVTCT